MPNQGGRPTKLTDDLAQRIVAKLRMGCYVEEAAAATGVSKHSIYAWEKIGATVRDQIEDPTSGLTLSKLSTHERRCLDFLEAVETAQDSWFSQATDTLNLMSFGGHEAVTVTVTEEHLKADDPRAPGEVIRTVTKTEILPPNLAALTWRMERLRPKVYGRRAPLDVNLGGQADNPVRVEAVSAAQLLESLDSLDAEG